MTPLKAEQVEYLAAEIAKDKKSAFSTIDMLFEMQGLALRGAMEISEERALSREECESLREFSYLIRQSAMPLITEWADQTAHTLKVASHEPSRLTAAESAV